MTLRFSDRVSRCRSFVAWRFEWPICQSFDGSHQPCRRSRLRSDRGVNRGGRVVVPPAGKQCYSYLSDGGDVIIPGCHRHSWLRECQSQLPRVASDRRAGDLIPTVRFPFFPRSESAILELSNASRRATQKSLLFGDVRAHHRALRSREAEPFVSQRFTLTILCEVLVINEAYCRMFARSRVDAWLGLVLLIARE